MIAFVNFFPNFLALGFLFMTHCIALLFCYRYGGGSNTKAVSLGTGVVENFHLEIVIMLQILLTLASSSTNNFFVLLKNLLEYYTFIGCHSLK